MRRGLGDCLRSPGETPPKTRRGTPSSWRRAPRTGRPRPTRALVGNSLIPRAWSRWPTSRRFTPLHPALLRAVSVGPAGVPKLALRSWPQCHSRAEARAEPSEVHDPVATASVNLRDSTTDLRQLAWSPSSYLLSDNSGRLGSRQISEPRVVVQEGQFDLPKGATAVLGNVDLGDAPLRRVRVVDLISVNKKTNVAILLYRPTFPQVRKQGALVGPVL